MSDYKHLLEKDARLIVLRELEQQTDGRLSETILVRVLDNFGISRSREWLRVQLIEMEALGAIIITEVGSVMIASITRAGLDHVERREIIEGIAKPSPAV